MTNFGLINQSDYSSSIENKSKILGSKKNKMSYISNDAKPDTTFPELKEVKIQNNQDPIERS